ncbi:hypothetical protein Pfo_028131 [Paulownia fortunei]|nr:hypothetical protein Pfo_028131 [Paulownia fortunei]
MKYPIVEGGMTWAGTGVLAAAVSEAGGLGCTPRIKRAKALTDKPFGVNVMLLSRHIREVFDVIIEEKVAVVATGAGDPSPFLDELHAAGIIVMPVVPSVSLAKMMEKKGVDAVVAEGMESVWTYWYVDNNGSMIAAGGIGDGRGVAAAFMLGAAGAQMGTRFLTAAESEVHPNFKAKILKAKDIDTIVTGNLLGNRARVLKNKMAKSFVKNEVNELQKEKPDAEAIEKLESGTLSALYKKAIKMVVPSWPTIDQASAILGYDLATVVQDETKIFQTQFAQPAILAMSVAIANALGERLPQPVASLGLSLGEYSALTVQVHLVLNKLLLLSKIVALYASRGNRWIANDVDEAVVKLTDAGIKRTVELPLTGAFHTPLLKDAASQLATRLAEEAFNSLQYPVYSNTTAKPFEVNRLHDILTKTNHITTYFAQDIEQMVADGVDTFIEIGPSETLVKFAKKIAPKTIKRYAITDLASFNEISELLMKAEV